MHRAVELELEYTNNDSTNLGDSAPFLGREQLGPRLTQCRMGRGLPPGQVPASFI